MKKNIFYPINYLIIFSILSSALFVSCESESESSVLIKPTIELSSDPNQPYPVVTTQVKYNEMSASYNASDLVYDETTNNVSLSTLKDSVVVFVEGGPKHLIEKEDFNLFKSLVLSGGGGYITPNGFPNHSFIGMHQMHEVNPTVFGSGTSFTSENAKLVNNQTLDMIERVVKWLKSKNKVVFLFGHSNGSLMVQNYMASGRANPSYYVITGTRLKTIDGMIQNYPKNFDFTFEKGIKQIVTPVAETAKPYFNVMTKLQMNHNKDYISLLTGHSMLAKTFYGLSEFDEAVGRVSSDEFNFVSTYTNHIFFDGGEHGEAALGIIYALDLFRNKKN